MFVLNWFVIQAKIIKNSFQQDKRQVLFKDLWHTFILFLGLGMLYIFLIAMFSFVDKKNPPGLDFAFIFLSFSLLLFLPLVFYSAIICSLSFLFEKEETQFYFSSPLSRLSVFTVRFIQTYFHTNWMVFLGLFTFLVAMQVHFKTTPLIYLTGSLAFLAFLLLPVCLAVISVIVISRIIPFGRAKGILVVIGLFAASIVVAAIRMMQPERLVTAEGKMLLFNFIHSLHKPWMTFLPSEWATNILFAQIGGDLKGMIVNFFVLLAVLSGLVIAVYILANLFYGRIWAEAAVMSNPTDKRSVSRFLLQIFPSSLRSFIQKDILSFYRDVLERGSLLILLPLCAVYFYSIYVLNRQIQNTLTADRLFSFLYLYTFNLFCSSVVVSGLSGRWIFPSVSVEGNNFRLIKISPTGLQDFLRAKFLIGFVPIFCIDQILILVSAYILRLDFLWSGISALAGALLCLGITLVCLILGVRQADFSIKNPLDFALSYKGFLCLVWEGIFVVAMVSLVGIPTVFFLYSGVSRISAFSLIFSILVISILFKVLFRFYKSSLLGLAQREV